MKKGISLVALVITIIVLIILTAAVILTLVDTSILDKADEAKQKQNEQEVYSLVQREVLNLQSEDFTLKVGQGFEISLQERLNNKYPEAKAEVTLDGEKAKIKYILNNETYMLLLDKEYKLTLTENVETISTEKSYLGYYADVDGDKEPDGIIYADLAFDVSGQWGTNGYGKFSYEAKTGLKDYYVSKTNHEGIFGTKDVLTAIGEGNDRFYVMALEHLNQETKYTWYDAAYDKKISDYSEITSTNFGDGRKNTVTMIEKWNNSVYGAQNDHSKSLDIWGAIQDQVNEGWFVPSNGEWSAFSENLYITPSNYSDYGLLWDCWSSSLYTKSMAYDAGFGNGGINAYDMNTRFAVRLSTTY